MDDTARKEAALKGLKYKIVEIESEIRTQVDIYDELRDNIRKGRIPKAYQRDGARCERG